MGLSGSPSMSMSSPPLLKISWPQPTAQYGQTLSVTVAPRSREAFVRVCKLKGSLEVCGCRVNGKRNILTPSFTRITRCSHVARSSSQEELLEHDGHQRLNDDWRRPCHQPFKN